MSHVYYIGGPADLTKRYHSERLFHHDLLRFDVPQLYSPTPNQKPQNRSANYRLQQLGPDLFVGIFADK